MARQGRAAVLGRPIAHSLSPVLHRAAYAELGLDWQYEAIECGAEDLAGVLAERPDWAGFSCTMPVKDAALELAQRASASARAAGAANTLLPCAEGGWWADNTDVGGIVAALQESGIHPERACVLGAGGTARAAVVALAQLGVTRCAVLVRDPARAQRLRGCARAVGVAVELAALEPNAPALRAGLVVSTLPVGAADRLASREWAREQALLDVVYQPWPTPIAAAAAAGGASVVSGALLLLHQAADQVRLMTGRAAPLAAMRDALLAASPGCGA